MNEKYFDANLKRWDEVVDIHAKSRFYDLKGFKSGKTSLLPIEVEELGDVSGKSLLHLQCHFGLDTISWARLGAKVTGIDFSEKAIMKAKELSKELNLSTNFIQTNIYDIPKNISEQFDIVFTSYGVLCWLPDLEKWAEIIDLCLKPGGIFYIVESHPFTDMIDYEIKDNLILKYPYTSKDGKPLKYEEDGTYTDVEGEGTILENKTGYEWAHSFSCIINSLLSAGLQIEYVHEFPYGFFAKHPDMKKDEDGFWRFQTLKQEIPLIFSIKARKPK